MADFATPLSYQVLQRRARLGELETPELDQTNRDVQAVHRPIRGIHRQVDDAILGEHICSAAVGTACFASVTEERQETPVWAWHGRKGRG